MSARPRGRILAAALALPLVISLAACDNDKKNAQKAANSPCPAAISQTASIPLPADVPAPSGTVYDHNNQGKTQFWFVAVDGTPDQLASLRDGYDSQLTGKGYTIGHHDQEDGAEAESEKEPWHDAHPAVQKLKSFREALNERSRPAVES